MSTIETAAERSDPGTYRPRKKPITDKGAAFEPFHVIYRDPQIRNLPATILELFRLFVPEFLVIQWVKWTSDYMESTQYSETLKPQSRTKQWIPTSTVLTLADERGHRIFLHLCRRQHLLIKLG